MIDLVDICNSNTDWQHRVRILILAGWSNAAKSTLPADNIFWTDGIHTMHYRAKYLSQISFPQFYNLVYNHNILAC